MVDAVVHGAGLRAAHAHDFSSVAVLTPYKAQLRVLRDIFK